MSNITDLQEIEGLLAAKTASATNPLISQIIQQLDKAVVYSKSGNLSTNQKLWDNYSKEWGNDQKWLLQQYAYRLCQLSISKHCVNG